MVRIIGKTHLEVKIGDGTWAFVDTYYPRTYEKNDIMSEYKVITDTQRRTLESAHIKKLTNDEKLLGANSTSQDLMAVAINIHLIL